MLKLKTFWRSLFLSLLPTVCPGVQVSFGRDFEQQLSFCVEARATFCNLEPVLVHLIHVRLNLTWFFFFFFTIYSCFCVCVQKHTHIVIHLYCHIQTVNQLAMETRRVMRGNHSRKTAAFVRVSLIDMCFCPRKTSGSPFMPPDGLFPLPRRPGVRCLQFHHHPVPGQHL